MGSTNKRDPRDTARALAALGLYAEFCDHCHVRRVSPDDVGGAARHKAVSCARIEFWIVLRKKHRMSTTEVGRVFGRDHTTIVQGCSDHRRRQREEVERARRLAALASPAPRPIVPAAGRTPLLVEALERDPAEVA